MTFQKLANGTKFEAINNPGVICIKDCDWLYSLVGLNCFGRPYNTQIKSLYDFGVREVAA